jgi:hypothetical protein
MGEVERGPGRGAEERENHRGFSVRKAQAKLTVAKAVAEAQHDGGTTNQQRGVALRAG